MNGSSRSAPLTYYEQLGVPANATAEEIRDAYRALARLLHPDQQTDPNLKRIAEQQMRRLNPIYTVLSDAGRRRQYDEDLAEEFVAPIVVEGTPPPGRSRAMSRVVWGGAVVLVGGLLFALASGNPFNNDLTENRTIVPILVPQTKGTEPSSDQKAEIATLQSQIKTLTAERDFAMRELMRAKGMASTPAASTGATVMSPAPAPAPLAAPPAPVATRIPSAPPAKPTLSGFWYFAAPKSGQKGNAPDTIETTIVEQNGVIKGKYHSRSNDRSPNPEINFTFTGTPNGNTLTCPWTGPGGAKGEVTMKMTSDNAMRLDWAASELGSQMSLPSGTALLTRRVD